MNYNPKPTNELRFVRMPGGMRLLQQLWRDETMPDGQPPDWREVPCVKAELVIHGND